VADETEKSQESLKKLGAQSKITAKDLKSVNDVMFATVGITKKEVQTVRDRIWSLRQLEKSGKSNVAVTKALAREYRDLGQMQARAAAGTIEMGESTKKSIGATRLFGQQFMKTWQGAAANILRPSQKASDALIQLAPQWSRATLGARNMGAGLLKFNMAALGVGAGITLLSFIVKALGSATRGTVQTYKTLTGTIGANTTTVAKSADMYGKARLAGAIFGANQEEILSTTKALTRGFAINQMAMKAFGESASKDIGFAIGEFIGLTKVAGMTGAEANKLAISFVQAGGDIRKLPDQFARLQLAVQRSGLDTFRFSEALAALAPLSTAASGTTEDYMRTVESFSKVFMSSTDRMLASARQHGQFTRFARAMEGFGQAAAQLTLPELMAIGGGAQAGIRPGEALEKALNKKSRPQVLLDYIGKVIAEVPQGLDKIFQSTVFLNQRFGMDAVKARDLAAMVVELQKKAATAKTDADRAQVDALKKSLETSAALTSLTESWQDKLLGLVESILIAITSISGFLTGGGRLAVRAFQAARSAVSFRSGTVAAGG